MHATPGFSAGADTELNLRTLSTFFDLLEVLLRAGVTTVAEAAFQDRLWRPGLERLSELADIRIVHCVIAPEVAAQRIQQRHQDNPLRGAHSASTPRPSTHVFDRVSVDTASLEVDTTDGYRPELGEIVAFIDDRRHSKGRGSARP